MELKASPACATGAAAAAVTEGEVAAAITSSVVITPSGPVPRNLVMSTPRSFARGRPLGEMRTPLSAEVSGVFGGRDATEAVVIGRACSVMARPIDEETSASAGGCSPGATIHAMV